MKILLLVEDFSYFLKFKNNTSFEVVFAFTEAEAFSLLKKQNINLVFCDPRACRNWNHLLNFKIPVIAHSESDSLNLKFYTEGALATLKREENPQTNIHNFIVNCLDMNSSFHQKQQEY